MSDLIKITQTAPALTCDYEGLKQWALSLVSKYKNLIVTEDEIAGVRQDLAEINRQKGVVDEARKEAVRKAMEPIKAFEGKIKDVTLIFENAYAELSAQIKVFEEAQRAKKLDEIKDILKEEFGGLELTIDERWLNKSTSYKSIREEIKAIIARREEEARVCKVEEQAQLDRAAAIEAHVRQLNAQHGLDIKVANFVMMTSVPLEVVLESANDLCSKQLKIRAEEQVPAMASAPGRQVQFTPPTSPTPSPVTASAKSTTMSIVLEFNADKASQVEACLEKLKGLCTSYSQRQR